MDSGSHRARWDHPGTNESVQCYPSDCFSGLSEPLAFDSEETEDWVSLWRFLNLLFGANSIFGDRKHGLSTIQQSLLIKFSSLRHLLAKSKAISVQAKLPGIFVLSIFFPILFSSCQIVLMIPKLRGPISCLLRNYDVSIQSE